MFFKRFKNGKHSKMFFLLRESLRRENPLPRLLHGRHILLGRRSPSLLARRLLLRRDLLERRLQRAALQPATSQLLAGTQTQGVNGLHTQQAR